MSLRDILRELSSKHSLMQIHTELLAMMTEEYAALKEFFAPDVKRGKKKGPVPEEREQAEQAEQAHEQAPEQAPEQAEQAPRLIANTKIRIIKKDTSDSSAPANSFTPAANSVSAVAVPNLKAWQKEQELKKLAELTAKGVNPENLLTVESIKKWIEDEQRTFAYVAREHLGMPESKVADFAREHGIKSTITKKRAILAAKNRAQ